MKENTNTNTKRTACERAAIATGAPRVAESSPLWNEWAANNPQPEAIALAKLDAVTPMMQSMKAIATGAQPVSNFY